MDEHNLPHLQNEKNGRGRVVYIHSYMFCSTYKIYANILNERLKGESRKRGGLYACFIDLRMAFN